MPVWTRSRSPDSPAADWDRTIVAFESPCALKDLSLPREPDYPDGASVDQQQFKIRLARGAQRMQSTSMLVQRMYSGRGYETQTAQPSPERLTLMVCQQDKVVGTHTLGFESPEGFQADVLYRAEVDSLRGPDRRLCELTRLAVDENLKSKSVLAGLFHIDYIYARRIYGATDFITEVNPRHVVFYKRTLGFSQMGAERHCPRVNAPAVLLHLSLDYVDQEIARLGGRGSDVRGHSLYPYFFSKKDEDGIVARLTRGGD
jgi:hypothetical protein